MEESNKRSQTQQTANPTTPTVNSDKSKLVPIILGIAAAIVIAIGAYVLGTKQSQPVVQNLTQTTPSPSKASATKSIPSPTPIPDETADWKTYAMPRFSIRLPTTWSINKNMNGVYKFSSGLPGRSELLIEWTPFKTAEDVETTYGLSGKPIIRQLMLGTASATEYYDCIGIKACMDVYILIINDAGSFYGMQFTPYPDQQSGLYQQILSTFKFTSP